MAGQHAGVPGHAVAGTGATAAISRRLVRPDATWARETGWRAWTFTVTPSWAASGWLDLQALALVDLALSRYPHVAHHEIYSRIALADAHQSYDAVIDRFPA